MEFGLTFDKLLLIGLVAVLIIGPERLPKAAEAFAKFVRRAGEYLRDTRSKMRDELGPEMDDVDWRKLDPRQYDPRRIIRDALFEEPEFNESPAKKPTTSDSAVSGSAPSSPGSSNPFTTDPVQPQRTPMSRTVFSRVTPPPFDAEAT